MGGQPSLGYPEKNVGDLSLCSWLYENSVEKCKMVTGLFYLSIGELSSLMVNFEEVEDRRIL